MLEQLHQYDKSLFLFLNQLSSDFLDPFWIVVTQIYTWIPLFIFMIVLVFKHYDKKQAVIITITVLITLLFTLLFTEFVKEWIGRLRPNNDTALSTLIKVLQSPHDFSFFSGHASNSFAIVTILFLVLRKQVRYIKLLFIWPVLFCLSRIFVGVHYPSDIIAGTFVGIFIGIVFHRFLVNTLK
ncbi:phosphatase PAP2 family protein [Ascidiimonas sp. W6]|uniref:phosphatase PAP2 family protein n=1 Tax=Ascidiimonas meishanensis TaxID=3128903 RepID=UPI0030EF9288